MSNLLNLLRDLKVPMVETKIIIVPKENNFREVSYDEQLELWFDEEIK